MKKIASFLLCGVMLLSLLSGCGASPEPPGGESTPAVPEETEVPRNAADEEQAPAAPQGQAEVPGGETTLMIYMIASDLESRCGEATTDLQEIAGSGVDLEKVRVLVCAGGTEHWHNEWMDTGSETLLRLTPDGYEKLGSLPLQSMGDPACLAAFLNYCTEQFPAEHYALIFWDHGNGPVMGYGLDTQFEKDGLTLSEMRQAMDQTPFAGELHLDWVGFDACLMASAELACVWQDYADYLIASQEVEPFFGWNYAFLASCGTLPARDLSRQIADAYLEYAEALFAEREYYRADVTMSVLDLSRAGELEAAIGALFRAAADDVSGDYVRLAQARVGARALGRATTGSEYDLVDLQTVAESLAADYPEESAALLALLEDMVVCSVSNAPRCCGVSLYYPFYNKKFYRKAWKETYRELAAFPDYLRYLERYEQIWLGSDMQRFFSDSLEPQAGAVPSTYTLQLSPEQAAVFASANYYILNRYAEGLYTLVYCSDDVTLDGELLTAAFDGNILYYDSDYGVRGIPFTRMWDTVDQVSSYSALGIVLVRGDFLDPDSEILGAEIRFTVDRGSGQTEIKGIYSTEDEDEDEFSGGKQEALDLADWDQVRFFNLKPRYLIRDENGKIPYFWDWPESGWITWRQIATANHPCFRFEPLYDDGTEYYILFNVADVQGNTYSSELFPLQLASAPEQEEAPAKTVVWDGGDSVVILETEDVTVSVAAARDFKTGAPIYCLLGSNRSQEHVYMNLGSDSALINGEYAASSNSLAYLHLAPGETGLCAMPELAKGAGLSSQGRLCSLECAYDLYRGGDYATLAQGRLKLTVPSEPDFPLRWNSLLDARAEEQLLLDVQGLRITLLGLGKPLDGSPLAALQVENRSGADRELQLLGFTFDGIFFYSGKKLSLRDGQLCLPMLSLDPDNVSSLGYSGIYFLDEDRDALPHIPSISDAALILQIDGELYTCPIVLAEHGDQEPPRAEGRLLYQDDTIELRLWRHDSVPFREDQAEIWYFWVVNRSDHIFFPRVFFNDEVYDSDSLILYPDGWEPILPGGISFCSYAEPSREGRNYSFVIGSFDDYETPLITLPLD